MQTFKFPADFIWGTATSAHQTEGNNTFSDWWHWEHRDRSQDKKPPQFLKRLIKRLEDPSKYPLEPSLDACDSYNRYEEDLDLCKKLYNNAVRLGIEWARIEPEKGKFDADAIAHYKKVLESAKTRGLKTFVTLHHFTNPKWVADLGGWTNHNISTLFANYTKKCAEEFGNLIDVYLTINEPQVYSLQTFLFAKWPPQKANPLKVLQVQFNFIRAHKKAYKIIKATGNYQVGIVKNIMFIRTKEEKPNLTDLLTVKFLTYLNSNFFLNKIKNSLDLIGLNYYFTDNIKNMKLNNTNDKVSDLGWWLETNCIKNLLLETSKYKLPIFITENGLADANDTNRTWYIKEILKSCEQAINEGGNLKGYFHWSLIDNYEWHEGFWPRFGLVEIDRNDNLKRIPRPSFYEYSKICESGTIK